MSRTLKTRAVCFAVVFALALLLVPSDYPLWLRLTVILAQALTFVLQKNRSLLSFAASYIPAIFLLLFFDREKHALLPLAVMLFSAASVVFVNRSLRPEVRPGTSVWVGTLLLVEVMTCEILIFVL